MNKRNSGSILDLLLGFDVRAYSISEILINLSLKFLFIWIHWQFEFFQSLIKKFLRYFDKILWNKMFHLQNLLRSFNSQLFKQSNKVRIAIVHSHFDNILDSHLNFDRIMKHLDHFPSFFRPRVVNKQMRIKSTRPQYGRINQIRSWTCSNNVYSWNWWDSVKVA